MTPSGDITPARYSSATASIIPDPQIPVIPKDLAFSSKDLSVDQNSQPII